MELVERTGQRDDYGVVGAFVRLCWAYGVRRDEIYPTIWLPAVTAAWEDSSPLHAELRVIDVYADLTEHLLRVAAERLAGHPTQRFQAEVAVAR